MKSTADDMLRQISEGRDTDGKLANSLLSDFFNGYPVESLGLLLESSNHDVATRGTWMASELEGRVLPLLPILTKLLMHQSPRVRFLAVDAIWGAGQDVPPEATAKAFLRLDDEDEPVRWKTGLFLARMDLDRLTEASKRLDNIPLARRIDWLIERSRDRDVDAIIERLGSTDASLRFVAGIAAARIAANDSRAIRVAVSAEDTEVRNLAQHLESLPKK